MKLCFDLTICDSYSGIGQVANKYITELLKLNSVTVIKYRKKALEKNDFEFVSYYNILSHLKFYFFLIKTKPQAIIIPHYFIPFFIPSNIHIYTIVHDVMAINKSNLFFKKYSKLKSNILFILLKYNLCSRKNITVITPSYSVAKDVKTLFDKNSKVIPNGQFELLKLGSIVKENYFLYVGNPRFHKNLNNLITYFNSKSINFLKVVSDINLVNDLQNVEVYGKLDSKSEIIELIKKSRGIIMPSFCEGFGLPIIESLYYCGNAFSSDIDVFKEFYGLNIDYFDPNQLDQLNLTLNYNHQIIPRSKLKILNLFIWEELKYFLKKEFS